MTLGRHVRPRSPECTPGTLHESRGEGVEQVVETPPPPCGEEPWVGQSLGGELREIVEEYAVHQRTGKREYPNGIRDLGAQGRLVIPLFFGPLRAGGGAGWMRRKGVCSEFIQGCFCSEFIQGCVCSEFIQGCLLRIQNSDNLSLPKHRHPARSVTMAAMPGKALELDSTETTGPAAIKTRRQTGWRLRQ